MRLDGIKIPLMVVKSDGGFTYDTSDLTAIIYRFKEQDRNWLIYCVGSEQGDHLKAVFQAGILISRKYLSF
jgi:arginyl-tRNA synthetase